MGGDALRLSVLPAPQRRLWDELHATPKHFTLYGGTALALRLGHRQSVDFDFFSAESFVPTRLSAEVDYLRGATLRREAANTLTMSADRGGPVLLSFFGGLRLGLVREPEVHAGVSVASLLDIAATKVKVVTERAEAKDYVDIGALLDLGGVDIPTMLAAARVVYGAAFNPYLSLKAIAYHDDEALEGLSVSIKDRLREAVRSVDPNKLPDIPYERARP
jgi:hypothetical protein